ELCRYLAEIRTSYEEKATTNIKKILSIYKIAEREEVNVAKEELEAAFETYRRNINPEKLKEIDLNRVVRNLHENILIDKVFRFLYENANRSTEDLKYGNLNEVFSK
ncbi:hypothetical protein BSN82_17570, partial [Acinetobacter baylyi]|uniref:hypothetical protein n=1 Tax=Acinetobacter baylyi TaxID=202950 RepID=UPI0013D41177